MTETSRAGRRRRRIAARVAEANVALAFERRLEGETIVLCLLGEFDAAQVESFRSATGDLDRNEGPVVIDLAGLEFIDSRGLEALIELHARAAGHGCELSLRRGGPGVQSAIALSGLESQLPFAD